LRRSSIATSTRAIAESTRSRPCADAAREEDGDEYRALKRELARSQHERLRLARRIGFSECSRPLAGPAG